MNRLVYLKAFPYHCFNLAFIVINYVLVRYAYNNGLYGTVSEDLDELMRFFVVENLFNPIDLLFICALGIMAFIIYKQHRDREIILDWKLYQRIFIFILLIGIALLALLYPIRNEGGAILMAWLLIFYHPILLNCLYVSCCRRLDRRRML